MDLATGTMRGTSCGSSRLPTPDGSVSLSTASMAALSAATHTHTLPVHVPSRLARAGHSNSEQSRDVSRQPSPAPSEAGDFADNMSGRSHQQPR